MKTIDRKIPNFDADLFFSPIRDKISYAKIILYAARLLITEYEIMHPSTMQLRLIVDKMSRVFFYNQLKFFSLSFPFTIIENKNDNNFTLYYGKNEINNESISGALSILKNPCFINNPHPMDFRDEEEYDDLKLVEGIFTFEPSYIRYDWDKENSNGKIHPEHHLDINFSSNGTFKIGLNKAIKNDFFENLLNLSTECLFLTNK